VLLADYWDTCRRHPVRTILKMSACIEQSETGFARSASRGPHPRGAWRAPWLREVTWPNPRRSRCRAHPGTCCGKRRLIEELEELLKERLERLLPDCRTQRNL